MEAPIKLAEAKVNACVPGWPTQALVWADANHEIGRYYQDDTTIGNPRFSALAIKAGYVMGVIHDLCTTVDYLIKQGPIQATYLPAYGVCCAALDLLGRCIKGESRPYKDGLRRGLSWVSEVDQREGSKWAQRACPIRGDRVLIKTSAHKWTLNQLEDLRNFAVHGQATSKKAAELVQRGVDHEVLEELLPKLASALEVYWNELTSDEYLCCMLASANIVALRPWPIAKVWKLFSGPDGEGDSITAIWGRFHWRVTDTGAEL